MGNSFTYFISKFRIFDFILILLVLSGALLCRYLPIDINHPQYIFSDIDYQEATETIPYGFLCIATYGIGSLLVFSLWTTLSFDVSIFSALFSYLFSICLTSFLTALISRFVARPKPDTLAVCGGDGSISSCASILTPSLLTQQFQSFPSYHASESMASAVFIAMLVGEMWNSSSLFVALMKLIPICFAMFVSVSRLWDRQAHVEDVAAGILIGSIISYICFLTFKRGQKLSRKVNNAPAITETSALPQPTYM